MTAASKARVLRLLAPSLILIYNFIQYMLPAGHISLISIGVTFILYMGLVWVTPFTKPNAAYCFLLLVLWAVTISLWAASDEAQGFCLFLMIFLIAYTTRLSPWGSAAFAVLIVVSTSFVIMFFHQGSQDALVSNASIFLGMYALFTTLRIRKEASREKERSHAELYKMHQHLEQAHKELQKAHLELEEASLRSLQYAVLEERTRIARDIHDSVGHQLTSVIVQLQSLPYMMKSGADDAETIVKNVLHVARECLQEVRSVVHHMSDDESALGITAIRGLIQQTKERSGLDISLDTEGLSQENTWPPHVSETAYRVLQEALTNIIRHAGASSAAILMTDQNHRLKMTIRDNGVCKEPPAFGFGLTGMKERIDKAGGTLSVQAVSPHGLEIAVSLPMNKET